MNFDTYFAKYLDSKKLHLECKNSLIKANFKTLKFIFLLRTLGIHFGFPKVCFECHKTYLFVYKIIELNINHLILHILDYKYI